MYKTIKINSVVAFISILLYQAAFAEENANHPVLKGNTSLTCGIINGMMNEYVFDNGEKLSELNWDMKNILYTGFSAQMTFFDRIDIFGNLKYGYNDHVGIIEDSDWDYGGEKTNFSKHDCMLEKLFIANLSAGYGFGLFDQFRIVPSVGVYAFDIRMSAVNGYLEYPPGSEKEEIYGTCIIYRQRYIIPRIGMYSSLEFYIVSFELWGFVGFYGRCQAVDNHIKREIDFYDEVYHIRSYEAGSAAAFKLSDGISIKVSGLYQYIPLKKGSDYYIDTTTGGSSEKIKNSSGVKMSFTDFSVSLQFFF